MEMIFSCTITLDQVTTKTLWSAKGAPHYDALKHIRAYLRPMQCPLMHFDRFCPMVSIHGQQFLGPNIFALYQCALHRAIWCITYSKLLLTPSLIMWCFFHASIDIIHCTLQIFIVILLCKSIKFIGIIYNLMIENFVCKFYY